MQALAAVAGELAAENYNDAARINESRDRIVRLWDELGALLRARRMRLDGSHGVQKLFDEMLDILASSAELETKLRSEDRGQHLMDVEDLLQKHALAMSDLNVLADRVQVVNAAAEPYAAERATDDEYRPVEPAAVRERQQRLRERLDELRALAAERARALDDNRRLCQFYVRKKETTKIKSKPIDMTPLSSAFKIQN